MNTVFKQSIFCKSPESLCRRGFWVSGENVSRQLEVFESVEGDVSVVDRGEHHRGVRTPSRQLLQRSEVRDRAVEPGHRTQS